MLRLRIAQEVDRAAGVAGVAQDLGEPAQPGAAERGLGGAAGGPARLARGRQRRDALGEVAEKALGHQLHENGVVALEGRVDIQVGAQPGEAVLGQEASAAAGLAALLQGVQGQTGGGRLERGGHGLQVLAGLVGVVAPGEDAVEGLEQLVVGEARGQDLGDQREQAALVLVVVQQHRLLLALDRGELTALRGVGQGDVQPGARGDDRRTVEGDAALDQRAEHREEAAARGLDGGGVGAVLGHMAVAVEQVLARHAHVVEVQAAVVDAVETALVAVVLAADAGQELALVIAQRHEQGVDPVVHAVDDQLGEHDGRAAVQSGVAQVVLPGPAVGRVDLELLRAGVEGGGGGDRGHIRAVAGLRHGEGARDLQGPDVLEPALVVLLGAQVHDGGAEQAPLHARLDLQRRIREDELLEAREVGGGIS